MTTPSQHLYTKKVMQHFQHPHNIGTIKDPDGLGKVGNPVCGDVLWIYIKIKGDKIADIKFETFGCTAAIATSSMLTVMAKGKKIKQAISITNQQLVQKLGTLPVHKLHCSLLAVDALHEALYDYYKRTKQAIPEELERAHEKIKAIKHGHIHA